LFVLLGAKTSLRRLFLPVVRCRQPIAKRQLWVEEFYPRNCPAATQNLKLK
jgi:hypothetical protein